MNKPIFHDEATLADAAIKLGQQALAEGLIPSFVVRYFSDSRQFYIPNEQESVALTSEEAYMRLKRLTHQG